MKSGNSKTSRFKNVTPLMIYVSPKEISKIKTFAKSRRSTVSQIAREALQAKMAGLNDPFNKGFNAGLKRAMEITMNNPGAQMMFPSGRSFGELVCESIQAEIRHEERAVTDSRGKDVLPEEANQQDEVQPQEGSEDTPW